MTDPSSMSVASGNTAYYTHRSPDKETDNEDCLAIIPYNKNSAVLIVADGLGGYPAGDTASAIAIRTLSSHISQAEDATLLRDAILNGIEQANQSILDKTSGAATTLAIAELQGNTIRAYHVGDSIVMVCGQRGKLKFQSVAHSPVGYAVESGMLDQDEAVHHEHRHFISNAVGDPEMRIEIGATITLSPHDTLILASDGLTDNLYQDEIIELTRKGKLTNAVSKIVEQARTRMIEPKPDQPSHPDDLSVILYRQS